MEHAYFQLAHSNARSRRCRAASAGFSAVDQAARSTFLFDHGQRRTGCETADRVALFAWNEQFTAICQEFVTSSDRQDHWLRVLLVSAEELEAWEGQVLRLLASCPAPTCMASVLANAEEDRTEGDEPLELPPLELPARAAGVNGANGVTKELDEAAALRWSARELATALDCALAAPPALVVIADAPLPCKHCSICCRTALDGSFRSVPWGRSASRQCVCAWNSKSRAACLMTFAVLFRWI